MAVPHLRLIVGEFGSGKSLRLLEHGLELAEKYRKGIVANFPINISALREYCERKKYKWILSIIPFGQIRYFPLDRADEVYKILEFQNKVILLDEAGIFLNSRMWSKIPTGFLASLVQVRKDGNFFLLACHFLEQVDKQLRENCQYFIECRGISVATSSIPILFFRWWHEFKPSAYHKWLENTQYQNNFLRTWTSASKSVFKPVFAFYLGFSFVGKPFSYSWLFFSRLLLLDSDTALLFKIFDSAQRLDKTRYRAKVLPHINLGRENIPKQNGKVSKTVSMLNF